MHLPHPFLNIHIEIRMKAQKQILAAKNSANFFSKSLTFSEQINYCLLDYYYLSEYKAKRKTIKSCNGLKVVSFFVHKLFIHFG